MAIGDTLTDFFGGEWDRFVAGLGRVNPQDIRNIQDYYARLRLRPEDKNSVTIPGWDDVIRLGPRYEPTPEERAAYWAAVRTGSAPDISREAFDELERRRESVTNMRGATDAENAAGWGRIYNAIDNVQDLFVSVGLLGHLTLWTAPRIFGRFVPVVGSILRVSDLLNLLNYSAMLVSPVIELLCRGPVAGVLAALPLAFFGRAGPKLPALPGRALGVPMQVEGHDPKGHMWRAAMMSPISRRGLIRAGLGPFTKHHWFGLLVQGFQVTTSFWGYGLSLGGLVGMALQHAAGLALNAQGERVKWPSTTDYIPFYRMINRPLADDHPAETLRLHTAATVLATAPSLLCHPEWLSSHDYAMTLSAVTVAQQLVYQRLQGYPWPALLGELLAGDVTMYSVPSNSSLEVLEEHQLGPGELLPHDLPGSPTHATGNQIMESQPARLAAGIARFCARERTTPWGTFAGALVNAGVDHAWEHLAGQERPIRWEFTPDWAALTSLIENSRVVVTTVNPQTLWAFWQAARAIMEAGRGPRMTGPAWDALAAAHGVQLLQFLPSSAPWPPEWQAWAAAQQHARPSPT